MPRYQSGFDVLELIRAAGSKLATSQPEQFKVFVLAVMGGLRRNEIDKLEWRHVDWAAGRIHIGPTQFLQTKSDDSTRSIWIPPQMLEAFRSYRARATGRFVIESTVHPIIGRHYSHYRCQDTFKKLIAWLRAQGVDGGKPLHTLRKEFGSLIAQQFGIYAAKEVLGHADIATTAAHYLEAKVKPVINLGHSVAGAGAGQPLKTFLFCADQAENGLTIRDHHARNFLGILLRISARSGSNPSLGPAIFPAAKMVS